MRGSCQRVRQDDQAQPCLIRSHPVPAFLQKPESVSIERAPTGKHVSSRIIPRQDKPPYVSPLCVIGRVLGKQDKPLLPIT